MRLASLRIAAMLLTGALLPAQVPDIKSLSGKYFFREFLAASRTGTYSVDSTGSFILTPDPLQSASRSAPLAVETADGFTDLANIAIAPN